VIVDHQPKGRHNRFDESILRSLESISQGTPADVLLEAALALHIASIKDIVARSRLETGKAQLAFNELLGTGSLVPLEEASSSSSSDGLATARPHWNSLREKILQTVASYHTQYPLRRGIQREELKSKLKLSPRAFNAVLQRLLADHSLAESSTVIAKPEHEIKFDQIQQARVRVVMQKFAQNPFSPPGVKELQNELGEELLSALMELGEFVAVSSDVIFRKPDYERMVDTIRNEIEQKEKITLGEVRDLFQTSRKYAQALLEHLDAIGVTRREGDFRKLKQK